MLSRCYIEASLVFIAYKAYLVITIIYTASFGLLSQHRPAFIDRTELLRWFLLWLSLITLLVITPTLSLFYLAFLFIIVMFGPKSAEKRVLYYLFLLIAIPQFSLMITSVAGISLMLPITYSRLAIIALLLPLFTRTTIYPTSRLNTDYFLLFFVFIVMILSFRQTTFSNALRENSLLLLDIIVPYYIISRHIDTVDKINRAFYVLFIAIMPLSVIGLFEPYKHWLLYNDIYHALAEGRYILYDMRAGSIRAAASTSGGPVLGFIITIVLGLLFYLQRFITQKRYLYLAFSTLLLCLFMTKTRGAWLGFVVLLGTYFITSPNKRQQLGLFLVSAILLSPLLLYTAVGQKLIQLLPFFGDIRIDTIDYRSRLLEQSWLVIQTYPFFGNPHFIQSPALEVMRQGEGIIDIVNSYLQITLEYGFVTLSLFIAILLSITWRCYRLIKPLTRINADQLAHLSRVFFAIMLSIIVMIFTISMVNFIPVIFWVIIALATAFIRISQREIAQSATTTSPRQDND
ncbi:MAG TPA: hypothetical protein DCR13_03875 [Gammaproteobacteria bacterium]|nr:hypothetical protein [Gammaproteobacteria bacterium]